MIHRLTLIACFLLPLASAAQQKDYFQQEVNYTISVRLDDVQHMLHGDESFVYTNNSPETLDFLYIHLWPNAYKDKTTALARQLARAKDYILWYSLAKDKGYIDSLDFHVNGAKANWEYDAEHIDICKLYLPQPLPPGGRITVTTPFRVKIPSGSISRLGHIGTSYQVTQWYPKPAVYDRDGWHQMPYLTQGEFYSEFGSFDVSITLPENYRVGATGDLQTESEIAWRDSLAALPVDTAYTSNEFPESAARMKTIRYTQQRVHDFGWFADKRWIVRKGSVQLPGSGRPVTTWAMYTPRNAKTWSDAIEYLNDATYWYSKWNGDYPYNHVTAVDGTISAGGGMEYPNVTVIGSTGNPRGLEVVIMHEVGHNWFYGILASNERDNAWMDEGINSFNEDRYMVQKYPGEGATALIDLGPLNKRLGFDRLNYRGISELAYLFSASRELDQPMQCHADAFTGLNYSGVVYKKTALVFYYLQAYLGEALFDRCMQAYFDRWKFKHPQPADLQAVFEEVAQRDLDWFFQGIVNTTDKLDFAVQKSRMTKQGMNVWVKNDGSATGPASIDVMKDGKVVEQAWTAPLAPGERTVVEVGTNPSGADEIRIDAIRAIPEVDRSDNRARTRGLLRRVEPVQFKPVFALDDPDRSEVYVTPLVAWNEYNRWMAGVSLSNQSLFRKKVEWNIAPLYSFNSNNINGFASLRTYFGKFEAGVMARRFDMAELNTPFSLFRLNYYYAQPYVQWNIMGRPEHLNRGRRAYVRVDYQYREIQSVKYNHLADDERSETYRAYEYLVFSAGGKLRIANAHVLEAKAMTSINPDLSGVSWNDDVYASGEIDFSYLYHRKKKRSVHLRLFGGYALNGNWYAAGRTGPADFLFQDLYFGRTEDEGLMARQVSDGHGMLLAPTNARGEGYMFSATVRVPMPVRFPIGVYGGATTFYGEELNYLTTDRTLVAAGVYLPIVKDAFEVYIPLYFSDEIADELDAADAKWFDRIMFQLRLDLMNPLKILRNIEV